MQSFQLNILNKARLSGLAIITFLTFPQMAVAQDSNEVRQDPKQNSEIVVDGRLSKPAKHIPRLFESNAGQIARFEGDFCPSVSGLPEQYAATIKKMVRENAIALGLTVLEENCEPNAIIILSQNAPEYMSGLRKKKGEWFSSLTPRNRRLLTKNERSYYAWHVVSSRRVSAGSNFDLDNQFNVTASALGASGGTPNATEGQFGNPNSDGGRIGTSVEQQINLGFIVIDLLKTNGMSLRQIADFATLHLIMDIDSDHQNIFPASSILNLFDVEDPKLVSDAMTELDRLTAKGLYDLRLNNKTAWEQSRVVARYVRNNIYNDQEDENNSDKIDSE